MERDEAERFWLVDPEGCGFFSAGVDCVNAGNSATIVPGSEALCGDLPEPNEPLGYHGTKSGARGYPAYNYGTANLERAFGSDW